MQVFEVVVVGSGMVGLSIANGLSQHGIKVAVIDQQPMEAFARAIGDKPELRVSAINHASQQFFASLSVWKHIIKQRVAPYDTMEVWQKDSTASVHFDAKTYQHHHLGYIIENHVINNALWQQATQQADITFFYASQITTLDISENQVTLILDNQHMINAALIIGADGANSMIREKSHIPITFRDYGHTALVATIKTDLPHQECARQVFYGEGILALLPLYDSQLVSIVWSLPSAHANDVATADVTLFERELVKLIDNRFGNCQLVSERLLFPLIARYARDFAAERVVLAGDAAHTIHPLAGQGVNLGLMDAKAVVKTVLELKQQYKDLGYHYYWHRYERERKTQAVMMLTAMQGFKTMFEGHSPLKQLLRGFGMNAVDKMPFIKQYVVDYALGLKSL